jgi:hypothetical protein
MCGKKTGSSDVEHILKGFLQFLIWDRRVRDFIASVAAGLQMNCVG